MRAAGLCLLLLMSCLVGCSSGGRHTAHQEGGRICVEPRSLGDASDLHRVVHAAGYLMCRAQDGAPDDPRRVDPASMARLALVVAAEHEPGADLVAMADARRAVLRICEAAASETVRADPWPGALATLDACHRLRVAIAAGSQRQGSA